MCERDGVGGDRKALEEPECCERGSLAVVVEHEIVDEEQPPGVSASRARLSRTGMSHSRTELSR